MLFSKFFIDRPIFATVIAILMVLAGAFTVFTLPIAQYPDITPPTVMVSASYPGADAETVAKTVGIPIEQEVNGLEGMLYMSSNSGSDGSYSLTITFENGTDLDEAAVEVQNRVQQAQTTLPTSVKEQGLSVSKNSSNNVLFIALESNNQELYDATYLTNYAQLHLVDPLSRVSGVGGVTAFGGGEYSMRVWLDPDKMIVRGLSPSDVVAAIQSQNMEVSSGAVGQNPGASGAQFEYSVVSSGALSSPEEFEKIVLRSENGRILRLKDVARVELGSTSYSQGTMVNGEATGLLAISQLPGANALDVADGAIAELDRLAEYFPEGVSYRVVQNATDFVRASLDDVIVTFFLTSLIVMMVILIFLQDWRAVIIPMITIPVSLIATFAVMKLMGFSLNTLTLFGLVLAIAIVVDDAIVVVEDCARIVDKGEMNSRQAAVKAMKELTGPVVGEVLVLMSVFIPTAFISGITGQLYKQFALTIAVSTAFSGFNALTLTPALCALFLKPRKDTKFIIYVWFNKFWNKCLAFYEKVITKMLARPVISMSVFLVIAGAGIWAYIAWPSSYIPSEDMGYFMTSVRLPQSASLDRTEKIVYSLAERIRKEVPGVSDVMAISGFSFISGGAGSNLGILNIVLKPWKERNSSESIDKIMAHVDEIAQTYQEAQIFSVNPPAIPGLGVSGGLQLQLLDINSLGIAEMHKAVEAIELAASKDRRLSSVTSMFEGEVPQYSVKVDRDKVAAMNLNLDKVYNALSTYLGGSYVNDFIIFDRVFQVNLKGDAKSRETVDAISNLRVTNNNGELVPFATFAEIVPSLGSGSVSRYNMYTTASLTANVAKGVSSAEGLRAMEEIIKDAVGDQFSYAWTGEAYQESQSHTTISFVFIFAIIMTLLVLAAQYESWTDPVAVVLSMPIAILGTVLGCMFMDYSVSIYTQIGLILLLGMAAKNAILIVEYAMDFRKAGLSIRKAAHDAGVIRFRPIIMTACAFVFGVMPMMFATGAGANSRRELGTAVVFGMALNGMIGTIFVPTFWYVLQNFNERYLSKLVPGPKRGVTSTSDAESAANSI